MKTRTSINKLLGPVILACLLAAGCQPSGSKEIVVGKVDTAALLQDDPDYQSMSIEYIKQQTEIRRALVEKMRDAGDNRDKVQSLQEEYVKKQQAFDDEWKGKTEQFMEKRHDAIRDTASTIAKRKKIDLVIIDSKMYPTVEYGGADMTQDMALAMSSGSQNAPAATPSPTGATN